MTDDAVKQGDLMPPINGHKPHIEFKPQPVKITVLTTRSKHVRIQMNRATDRLELDPDEALALFDAVRRHAMEAKLIITGPRS